MERINISDKHFSDEERMNNLENISQVYRHLISKKFPCVERLNFSDKHFLAVERLDFPKFFLGVEFEYSKRIPGVKK